MTTHEHVGLQRFELTPKQSRKLVAAMFVPETKGLSPILVEEATKMHTSQVWARLGRKMGFCPESVRLSDVEDGFNLGVFYAEPKPRRRWFRRG